MNSKEEFEKRLAVVVNKENDYERFFAVWQEALEYRQEEINDLRGMLQSSIFVYEEQKERIIKRLNEATKIIEEIAYDCVYEMPIDMIEKARNFLKE